MQNHRKRKIRLAAALLCCATLATTGILLTDKEQSTQAAANTVVLTTASPATAEVSQCCADGIAENTPRAYANELAHEKSLALRAQVVSILESMLGTPYVYGGMSPSGFDCSGLVCYTYSRMGYNLTRCADTQLLEDGVPVSGELMPGDLVFFRDPGSPWAASHAGIYVGDGMMIHSSSSGVRYDYIFDDYYGSRYVGAKRIICDPVI